MVAILSICAHIGSREAAGPITPTQHSAVLADLTGVRFAPKTR
jgi:hypothetical protein